jgi:hypothetical protein
MSRHLEPQQLPPAVAQHQKREQSLKGHEAAMAAFAKSWRRE